MGVELSDSSFRENELNRFADQQKTINAFKLLKENNIKRTAYNIIGLPSQSESILETINFNKLLNPIYNCCLLFTLLWYQNSKKRKRDWNF